MAHEAARRGSGSATNRTGGTTSSSTPMISPPGASRISTPHVRGRPRAGTRDRPDSGRCEPTPRINVRTPRTGCTHDPPRGQDHAGPQAIAALTARPPATGATATPPTRYVAPRSPARTAYEPSENPRPLPRLSTTPRAAHHTAGPKPYSAGGKPGPGPPSRAPRLCPDCRHDHCDQSCEGDKPQHYGPRRWPSSLPHVGRRGPELDLYSLFLLFQLTKTERERGAAGSQQPRFRDLLHFLADLSETFLQSQPFSVAEHTPIFLLRGPDVFGLTALRSRPCPQSTGSGSAI